MAGGHLGRSPTVMTTPNIPTLQEVLNDQPAFVACEMPDLSDLEQNPAYLERVSRAVFHGTGPTSGGPLRSSNGLDGCLDKAVLDYQSARREVVRYLDAPNGRRPLSAAVRASLHLQGCLVFAQRMMKFAERLLDDGAVPGAVDRVAFDAARGLIEGLRSLRNAIEHMYEGRDAPLGAPAMPFLHPNAKHFDLGVRGVVVTTATTSIADLLRAMDALTRKVGAWTPPT